MKYWVIFFIFCSIFKTYSQSSLLEHPTGLEVVKKGLYYIYNTDTRKAEQYIHLVEELMPKHPVGPMMRALNTNWSSNPIESDSKEFRQLNGFLQLALDRTKDYLHRNPEDIEAIFFAIAIYGWLAQFYDEDGHTFKALNAAKKAYHYMKIGFDLLDRDPEFYFSTGLYNYYRVQYPESNPIYKPFVWFFRNGDKELGLQQLDQSANSKFGASKVSYYHNQHIGEVKRTYLPQYWIAGTVSGLPIVKCPEILGICTNCVRITVMPGLIMRLAQLVKAYLHLFQVLYRKGISLKLAAFFFVNPL